MKDISFKKLKYDSRIIKNSINWINDYNTAKIINHMIQIIDNLISIVEKQNNVLETLEKTKLDDKDLEKNMSI